MAKLPHVITVKAPELTPVYDVLKRIEEKVDKLSEAMLNDDAAREAFMKRYNS